MRRFEFDRRPRALANKALQLVRWADRDWETMGWAAFENGNTVGARGSEDGVIVVDEEHDLGARITLERDGSVAPFAITCGIYGWAFHTRFFSTRETADRDLETMKDAI